MIAWPSESSVFLVWQLADRQAFFVLIVGDEPAFESYGVVCDLATRCIVKAAAYRLLPLERERTKWHDRDDKDDRIDRENPSERGGRRRKNGLQRPIISRNRVNAGRSSCCANQ
jgi:hypothetical protein